ncbi:hypothetical protein [Cellulomonas sp. KRMCY2]|uniref:hypothetical protein n=1 Tax=Cellulomonas sp. KRMCY2 TaxID=1304865 RepID=UPI0012DEE6CB|nr:hypothetical protein [Cellulomonas sp. KRMCY2]
MAAIAVAVSTAVGLDRDEVTPAVPTPTETTAGSGWEPRWDWCGSTVTEDDFSTHTGEAGGFDLEWRGERVSTDPAAPISVSAHLVSSTGQDGVVDARVTEVTAGVLGEDMRWTVVGVESAQITQEVHGTVTDAAALDVPAETRLVSCEANPLTGGSGTLDTPVPAGEYWLLATLEVTTADGEAYPVFAPVAVIGEPATPPPGDSAPEGWPPSATDLHHGGETWGVYTVVLEAGASTADPRWLEGDRRLGALGYPAGGGELGCDLGATESLGLGDGAMAIASYFDTQTDAELFAQKYAAAFGDQVVGMARVTTVCMD